MNSEKNRRFSVTRDKKYHMIQVDFSFGEKREKKILLRLGVPYLCALSLIAEARPNGFSFGGMFFFFQALIGYADDRYPFEPAYKYGILGFGKALLLYLPQSTEIWTRKRK